MAETRQHSRCLPEPARRLPEIEARDEEYMRMRRAGYSSVEAARVLGLTSGVRQRCESDYNAQHAIEHERPANDDAYVAAVEAGGGFGRYVRLADGRMVYVPYALECRVAGARS